MTDMRSDVLEDEDFDTILSSDIDFSGTLRFEKPFLIRGRLSGEIIAHGLLMIDTDAVVAATINAPQVIVRGLVRGNITASDKIELTSGGKVIGNVHTPVMSMESGCLFNGVCAMDEKPAEHESV
ncbi:MAG: polymer-forming cytoskeletal protein, partial [Spirochaetaceae bacterium]|jgi:cytoskeletal protein CcmA (bactofilin family)|nr:polymer-forming cytoskeletal protein [Spirochaetaceae bacterium]